MDWKFFNEGLIHILGLEPKKDAQHEEIMGEIEKLEQYAADEQATIIKHQGKTILEMAAKIVDLEEQIKEMIPIEAESEPLNEEMEHRLKKEELFPK